MTVNVNIKSNIDPQLIAKRTPQADFILASQAQRDTEQFVPMLTGSLRQRSQVDGGKIVYPGPYAHYLWVGTVYVDPQTGYAGIPTQTGWFSRKGVTKVPSAKKLSIRNGQDHWFDASKAVNLDKWIRVYGRALSSGE